MRSLIPEGLHISLEVAGREHTSQEAAATFTLDTKRVIVVTHPCTMQYKEEYENVEYPSCKTGGQEPLPTPSRREHKLESRTTNLFQ